MKLRIAAAALGILLTCAAQASTDPVLEWNSIMLSTTAGQNPFFQARYAAITQLAVFEAMNAIDTRYDPYLGSISAPPAASTEAAAVAAAHAVLRHYFPASAPALDGAYTASLARIADGPRKLQGIATGEAAAAAMITQRNADGSTPPGFYLPTTTEPGAWQPTPGCPSQGGILLQWRDLRPFAIESTGQFRASPPPSLKSPRYTRDYNELRRVGRVDSPYRPQDRADVARFYAITAPIPVWDSIVAQIAIEQSRAPLETARVLALVNMAIADAQASVFDTKYHYNFWRPETAIRAGDADGNPLTRGDADFKPFVPTPCFPSYASAHGSSSAAAREVLEHTFGGPRHFIQLGNPALPDVTLEYSNLRKITDDIDDARIFGGIHFRFDQEAGTRLGRQVGAAVLRNTLRPALGEGPGGGCR